MLLLFLSACTGSSDSVPVFFDDFYTPALQACANIAGLDDEGCRTHLQQDIGLDTESFLAAGEDEMLELLLAGLYEVLMRENSEPSPRGETWYDMVANYIVTTRFDPDVDDDVWMSFRHGDVHVAPEENFNTHAFVPTTKGIIPVEVPIPVLMGNLLVHESSHAFTPSHLDSCDNSCDANMEGSYGVAAVWTYGWAIANRWQVTRWEYLGALGSTYMACMLLIVEPGYPCFEIEQATKE